MQQSGLSHPLFSVIVCFRRRVQSCRAGRMRTLVERRPDHMFSSAIPAGNMQALLAKSC